MKYAVPVFIALSLFVLSVQTKSSKEIWKHFKGEYNKSYESNEEDQKRYKIFKENYINIQKHNEQFKKGTTTYLQEINKFADLTESEFTELYGLYNPAKPVKFTNDTITKTDNITDDYFDWRDTGGITPAKNQGRCGACFIFSVVANIENYHFRKTGKLLNFSEQHVVDCLSNNTCLGGHPFYVFQFIQSYGIYLEDDYPYTEKQNDCKNNTQPPINKNFTDVGAVKGSDDDLKEGLKKYGPFTTCFSVTASWRFYKSGVWYHNECAEKSNHCLLIVGYGTENGNDYWIIKNSWGADWGDEGYIKMARNKHPNYCGFNVGLYII